MNFPLNFYYFIERDSSESAAGYGGQLELQLEKKRRRRGRRSATA